MRTARIWTVLAALAAAVLSGCGSPTLKADKIESTLERNFSKAQSQKVTVDCPDEVEAKFGTAFECKMTGSDFQTVNVILRNDDGSKISYIAKWASPGFSRESSGFVSVGK